MGVRDSLELLSRSRARGVAGAGGTALHLSSDRLDTMFASKTAMQHVSKPNVLMNARLRRLGRYYEGKPVLVLCYPLQELPKGIRVDGDGDWAPTTELLRRSTSGGAARYGLHTWDCYSVTQATIALSSAESEFYATGSATARDNSARLTCQKQNALVSWTCAATAQLGAVCASGQASAKYAI